jgi:hypothetical protein
MITKENLISVKQIHSSFGTWAYQVVGTDYKCSVPNDPDNTDYVRIQEWLADGNTLEPSDE